MPLALALLASASTAGLLVYSRAEEDGTEAPAARALIDGTGPGWVALGEDDFVNVNGDPDTWTWKRTARSTAPASRSASSARRSATNFELVVAVAAPQGRRQLRHLRLGDRGGARQPQAGKPGLPRGIEVQVLDHGYTEQYEKIDRQEGRLVHDQRRRLPRRRSKMKPFPPVSPDGERSFPAQEPEQGRRRVEPLLRPRDQRRSAPVGQRRGSLRRHRLRASEGFLCLESEGSPVEFRNLRIRELPAP